MGDAEQKKVLIVDDDSVVLRTMKDALSGVYKVYGANSGANALKILERIKPELILLDYEMPEMNGPAVLRKVKDNPETADIPVWFLTGREPDESMRTENGIGGVLQKGLAMDALLKSVEDAIGA